jgi:hypothetical protein
MLVGLPALGLILLAGLGLWLTGGEEPAAPGVGRLTVAGLSDEVALAGKSEDAEFYRPLEADDSGTVQLAPGTYRLGLLRGHGKFRVSPEQVTVVAGESVAVSIEPRGEGKAASGEQKVAASTAKEIAGTAEADTLRPQQTLDLLALTDAEKDRITTVTSGDNSWERQNGSLVYTTDGNAGKIAPPVTLDARHFEVEVRYERLSGDGRLHVDLPINDNRILPVYLDAPGFKIINMKAGDWWPDHAQPQGTGIICLERGEGDEPDHLQVTFEGFFVSFSGWFRV